MLYRIVQATEKRESFGEYRYQIFEGNQLIAHYWHDYRGDEHGIEFIGGKREACPVGRIIDFMNGGGGNPLELSKKANEYITNNRPKVSVQHSGNDKQ